MESARPSDISFSTDATDGVVVVHVGGELDLAGAEVVAGGLARVMDGGSLRVVVDLAGLRFIDAAGIGCLLEQRERYRSAGGDLTVRNASDEVQRVLEMAEAADLLDGAADRSRNGAGTDHR